MIRTQVSFDEQLYRRAKDAAKSQGVSLAELCRRGLAEVVARVGSDQPWMQYAGVVEGSAGDSTSVDEVVYGRDAP